MKGKQKNQPQMDLLEQVTMNNFSCMIRDDILRQFEEKGFDVICGFVVTNAYASVVAHAGEEEAVKQLKPQVARYIKQKYKINIIID